MKNTLGEISDRINEAKEWLSELKDRMMEITALEKNKEKRMERSEDRSRDLGDNIKALILALLGPRRKRDRE